MTQKLDELKNNYNKLREEFKSFYADWTDKLAKLAEEIELEKKREIHSPGTDGWKDLNKPFRVKEQPPTPQSDGWLPFDKNVKKQSSTPQPYCMWCGRPGFGCHCTNTGHPPSITWTSTGILMNAAPYRVKIKY